MKLKEALKSAKELEKKWLERQRAQESKIPGDFLEFCKNNLDLSLTKYQVEVAKLLEKHNDVALRWARQTGKTHVIAAWLLHYALTHENSHIAVIGPSWRQTIITITKMNYFRTKLPAGLFYKPQRTIVRVKNGSVIQALPNNPSNLRGFTLNIVYGDEMNHIPNDEEMFDAISFTLATTNGKFIASSTPWTSDHIFWKICNHEDFKHFAKSHVTWKQALEPNGPLSKKWLEKKRQEYRGDPWRWRREMEAEWSEDEDVWLSQSLITSCIDEALDFYPFEALAQGDFVMGLDLGKYHDYSVLTVLERQGQLMKLVHLHRFPLRTPYASVIGYVKTLCDRWKFVNKIMVDMTGVGEYIVEDMIKSGIHSVEGVKFTAPKKEEIATNLKQRMLDGVFKIPYVPVRSLRDVDLAAELNVERFELRKTGGIDFSHPEGTHNDVFWSVALACASARAEVPGKLVPAWK